jgi:hypothetical protein
LSEVTQLKEQIAREYEAAMMGLCGLSTGSARHAFINAKMETMARCQKRLIELTGDKHAMQHLKDALEDG